RCVRARSSGSYLRRRRGANLACDILRDLRISASLSPTPSAFITPSRVSMCTLSGAVSAVDSCRAELYGRKKIPSTTDVASLNTFGQNEIEVGHISSALLRIACLVILYKTCRVPDQELAADGVSGPV